MRPHYRLCVLAATTLISCGGPDLPIQQPTDAREAAVVAAWATVGSMTATRESFTATLLPSGKVLVAGGLGTVGTVSSVPLASAEIYDPVAKTWAATGSMSTTRADHTATLLPNGKVLVAGGDDNNVAFQSAELYDPQAGTWSPAGSMADAREFHSAVLLATGKVLVAGGDDGPLTANSLGTAELYNPATNTWSATGSMVGLRDSHTAMLLPSGKVLVAGGFDNNAVTATAELYDPALATWSSTGAMVTARIEHTSTLLQNGKVLTVGGNNGGPSPLTSAELYDPATGIWTATGSLTVNRDDHTATLLPSGNVLVVAGETLAALATAEVYDAGAGTWSATDSISAARKFHSATRLLSGEVLITGGLDNNPATPVTLSSAELFLASASALTISPATVATTAPGGSLTFTATGGSGVGYTWSMSSNPSGGSITSAGVYTAGSVGGTTDVIRVTDSAGSTSQFNVTVTAPPKSSGGCGSSGDGGLMSAVTALAAAVLFRRRPRLARAS